VNGVPRRRGGHNAELGRPISLDVGVHGGSADDEQRPREERERRTHGTIHGARGYGPGAPGIMGRSRGVSVIDDVASPPRPVRAI